MSGMRLQFWVQGYKAFGRTTVGTLGQPDPVHLCYSVGAGVSLQPREAGSSSLV